MATKSQSTSDWITVQAEPLNLQAVQAFLSTPEAGAINLFLGVTRGTTAGRSTLRLEYECYQPMALREMNALAEEARRQWPLLRVALLHRTGIVEVEETSVIVGVSSPHRDASFQACRFHPSCQGSYLRQLLEPAGEGYLS